MAKNDLKSKAVNTTPRVAGAGKPLVNNPITGETAVLPGFDPGYGTRKEKQRENAGLISSYNNTPAPSNSGNSNTVSDTTPQPNQVTTPQVNIPGVEEKYTPTEKKYGPLAGWDIGKLNNAEKQNTKYAFGRAVQDFGHVDRGNLQSLVDYYNNTYGSKFGNVQVTGEDTIRTPENWNIDIIRGTDEAPQWLVI